MPDATQQLMVWDLDERNRLLAVTWFGTAHAILGALLVASFKSRAVTKQAFLPQLFGNGNRVDAQPLRPVR
jgi:ABC-type cobalamin transport system permease subunit